MRATRSTVPSILAAGALCAAACGDGAGYSAADAGGDTDTATDAGPPPDCGDVWTDAASGLTWALLPSADTAMTWQEASDYCAGLELCGDGGWRLPTIGELRALVRGCDETAAGGECEVTDSCTDSGCANPACDGCTFDEGPDEGCYRPSDVEGSCVEAWSATATDDGETAWELGFRSAGIVHVPKAQQDAGARCVWAGH
jgi:hypothetical protein